MALASDYYNPAKDARDDGKRGEIDCATRGKGQKERIEQLRQGMIRGMVHIYRWSWA
jgi:hypothetical protein